jgi:crossover junction endodeoxyribonuclease RuvC
MTAFVGIDPGKGGAVALLPSEEEPVALDYPGDVSLTADLLRGWKMEHDIRLVALERVHSMPGQGVKSTFAFGRNLGAWEGVLAALGLPYVMVEPQVWQRGFVAPSDGPDPKARSLAVARRLFPTVDLSHRKDHGRADALLLALHAKRFSCPKGSE